MMIACLATSRASFMMSGLVILAIIDMPQSIIYRFSRTNSSSSDSLGLTSARL